MFHVSWFDSIRHYYLFYSSQCPFLMTINLFHRKWLVFGRGSKFHNVELMILISLATTTTTMDYGTVVKLIIYIISLVFSIIIMCIEIYYNNIRISLIAFYFTCNDIKKNSLFTFTITVLRSPLALVCMTQGCNWIYRLGSVCWACNQHCPNR